MQTIYDWLSVILFCAIALTYLHRSLLHIRDDPIVRYLPAAIGCALGNWLGNEGWAILASACLIATLAYYVLFLKPFADFE